MDLTRFMDSVLHLSMHDVRRCSAALATEETPVIDQVVQWRLELALDRVVRKHCTRAEAHRATTAGHRAAQAVVEVARRSGTALPDCDVTRVARAAGQIARGLALDGLTRSFVQPLVGRWQQALAEGIAVVVPAA
jgi:hypothetical protein